nr:hypothetical protein BaRGS_003681 [Batillaria attramentaria]
MKAAVTVQRSEVPGVFFRGCEEIPQKVQELVQFLQDEGEGDGNRQTNPTARSEAVHIKMSVNKEEADEVLKGQLKQCKIPSPLPVRIDESDRPADNNNAIKIDSQTAAILEQTRLPRRHTPPGYGADITWPRQGGNSESPVGNPASPKPVTPMNLGGEGVQQEARNQVSPCNPEQVAVRGAVATPPMEPVAQGLRTPGVEWPLAKSTEPPEV